MTARTIAYEEQLDAINAIETKNIKTPNMPMEVYLQEAVKLHKWAMADIDALSNAGINTKTVNEMLIRSDAASEAQSLWQNVMHARELAQKEWNEESPLAYDLRDEIIHAMRYAYRKDSDLLMRVSKIAEGNTNADMIQDLNDLHVLGRDHREPLKAVGFDETKIDLAAEKAKEMSELSSTAYADNAQNNQTKQIRDRAYTYLKQAVDEIRDCGQYVFWKNEDRRKGYASEYFRRSAKSNAKDTNHQSTGTF